MEPNQVRPGRHSGPDSGMAVSGAAAATVGAVVSHVNLMAINFGRRFVLITNLMSCQKWLQIYVAIRRAKRHLAEIVWTHRLLHFANEPRFFEAWLDLATVLAQAFQARGMCISCCGCREGVASVCQM